MWLFTRYGFYSVASARTPNGAIDPSKVMVRARRAAHLKNLQARFPALAEEKIVALPNRDYRWRLFVPKDEWVGIVAEMAEEQDWSNFKNEAARYQGAADGGYVQALHAVWSVMSRLQDDEEVRG
jgi:hypothetical protein